MADSNDTIFDIARELVFEKTVDAVGIVVADYRDDLEKFLKIYMDNFYGELVAEGVGHDTPSGIFPVWKNLSERMIDKKGSNSFYRDTGALKIHLLSRKANKDFGKPEVSLVARGRGLASNIFIDRAGRPQYKPGAGRKGFAAFGSAFSELAFSLEIRMFPKVQGKSFRTVFEGMELDKRTEAKLAVNEFGRVKGKQPYAARPLLRPFLKFYGGENLKFELEEKFGIKD